MQSKIRPSVGSSTAKHFLSGKPYRFLTRCFRHFTDFLYPPACINCRLPTEQPDALCPKCWGQLELIEQPYCERLGIPITEATDGPIISPAAIAEPPAYGRARSVCRYEGLARHLVYALKYGDKPEYAKIIGRMMHTAGRELIDDCDLIIPIPMHRRRLFHRHYNQAVILADTISQISGRQSSASALRRIRPTQPQSFLNKAQRRKNLKRAFAVAQTEAPMIKGARILLVDDVLTSGATADSATDVLLHTGASAVDILTFARVVKNYI